jgi:hypothetical protein
MMTSHRMSRLFGTAPLAISAAIAMGIASCSSSQPQPPAMGLATTQVSPSATEPCDIDAAKMCQATGGSPAKATEQQANMPASSYGPPNMPESVEFQIPAGQAIKLMCYYDPQHTSVYRADATPQSALTGYSVEYMKKQGFCTNK